MIPLSQTTLRYTHWILNHQGGKGSTDLIAKLETDHE